MRFVCGSQTVLELLERGSRFARPLILFRVKFAAQFSLQLLQRLVVFLFEPQLRGARGFGLRRIGLLKLAREAGLVWVQLHGDRSPADVRTVHDAGMKLIRAVTMAAAPEAFSDWGEELLLIGGEGHRPGTGGDTEARYAALETFAREHWDVRSVEYRWSAQDPVIPTFSR